MKKYIVEVDCTAGSTIENINGLAYGQRIFDTQRDAEGYALGVFEVQGEENVYLINIYEAEFSRVIYGEANIIAKRVAIFHEVDGINNIADEYSHHIEVYTRLQEGDSGPLLLGVAKGNKSEYNTETNRIVRK